MSSAERAHRANEPILGPQKGTIVFVNFTLHVALFSRQHSRIMITIIIRRKTKAQRRKEKRMKEQEREREIDTVHDNIIWTAHAALVHTCGPIKSVHCGSIVAPSSVQFGLHFHVQFSVQFGCSKRKRCISNRSIIGAQFGAL